MGPRPFPQGRRNEDGIDPRATMTYEDYVYFMLSEEDRGNEHSLRYWFACVDLDGDGRIGHMEMRLFYDNQASGKSCLAFMKHPTKEVRIVDRGHRVDWASRCTHERGGYWSATRHGLELRGQVGY